MSGPTNAAIAWLLAEAKGQLEVQVQAINYLDTKAAELFRFNSLFAGLLVAAASLLSRRTAGGIPPPAWVVTALIGGSAFVAASTAMAMLAFQKKQIAVGLPEDRLVDALSFDADEVELMRSAIGALVPGIRRNAAVLDRAARRFAVSVRLLLVGMLLLALAAAGLIGWEVR